MSTPARPISPDPSPFEERKWADEKALREREINLKQREIDKSAWASPLVLALCAAIVTALVTVYVSIDNNKRQHELELSKSEQARILEAIKSGDADQAAENLRFLLEAGLIDTPRVAERVKDGLAKRVAGKGPYLPPSYSPSYDYYPSYSPAYNYSPTKK